MASKFLSAFGLLVLVVAPSLAGIASYSYNPYVATYHSTAAGTAYTYSSHQPIYHAQPIVYQQQLAPVVTKHAYYSAAPTTYVKSAALVSPLVKTYTAAPAPVVATAPVTVTKTVSPVAAVVNSAPVTVAAAVPVLKSVTYDAAPRYDFSYGVHDSVTGDIKSHVESRTGGNVAGSYSVVDADGALRTVTYTADDLNGFNAVVQREPLVAKYAVAPAVAVPATPVVPVQQHFQYLPQVQPVQQQQPVAVAVEGQSEVVEAPAAVEYPAQQPQQPEVEQPSQQYPQDQQFPPFEQPAAAAIPAQPENNDDSDVIEARAAPSEKLQQSVATTAEPAPVVESQEEQKQRI